MRCYGVAQILAACHRDWRLRPRWNPCDSLCERSTCQCDDEWTGEDCSKTNYKAAKKIFIKGTPMDLETDPEVLEACRLTADASNGACFDYALSYKYVCARVSTRCGCWALQRRR